METGLVKRWIYAGVSLAALLSVMVSVVVAGTQGASGAQDATETVELVVDDGTETAVATGETTADATGEATNGAEPQASASLFAAIYAGTCADTGGEPTYQVGDLLTAEEVSAANADDTSAVGSADAGTMLYAAAEVEVSFDALFAADQPYALVVRDSADDTGRDVACGELGGFVVDGQVAVGLSTGDSGTYCGVAIFEVSDSTAQGPTPVRVHLFESAMGDDNADATADVTADATAQVDATEEETGEATAEVTGVATEEGDDDSGGGDDD